MICADFINGEYHCVASMADHIYGPYGPRYLAIPHGDIIPSSRIWKETGGAVFLETIGTLPFGKDLPW